MNRVRLVTAVLSAIAFLTAAVPLANAGGGMGVGEGAMACRTVSNGVNPPQILEVDGQSLVNQVVQVGPPVVLCEAAGAETVNINPPRVPEGASVGDGWTHLVCYPLSGKDNPKVTVALETPLTTLSSDPAPVVTLGAFTLMCMRAKATPQ